VNQSRERIGIGALAVVWVTVWILARAGVIPMETDAEWAAEQAAAARAELWEKAKAAGFVTGDMKTHDRLHPTPVPTEEPTFWQWDKLSSEQRWELFFPKHDDD